MKKLYILALASLVLASCDSNNDYPDTSSSGAAIITATIGNPVLSRAQGTSWDKEDSIGISSTVGEVVGPYTNLKYTTTNGDGIFTGKTQMFFYKPMVLTAYYPYAGTEGSVPGSDGIITANTSAGNQTAATQPKIDFLWDSKTNVGNADFSAGEPKVNFTFAHKMSKFTFKFLKSDPIYDKNNPDHMLSEGVDVADMISYKIDGLGVDGTFDTATGICAIDESKGRDGLTIEFPKGTIKNDVAQPSLIVFPQVKPTDKNFTLLITTDELNHSSTHQKYNCPLIFGPEGIKPGYHYTFTVQVTKIGLIVGQLDIEEWVESDRFLTATIDGDNPFVNKTN